MLSVRCAYRLALRAAKGHNCEVISGDFLTRATVWLALAGYGAAMIMAGIGGGRETWDRRARWCWTLGCAAYLAHVASAFHFFHGWSHAAAYADTARQTASVTGWNWGGGIYVNYLFTVAWLADATWWWRGLTAYRERPKWIQAAWQGFFWFMVVNATVVFGHGPVRWFGGTVCLLAGAVWWRQHRRAGGW